MACLEGLSGLSPAGGERPSAKSLWRKRSADIEEAGNPLDKRVWASGIARQGGQRARSHGQQDLIVGTVDPTDKFGNDTADGFAKQGARMHPADVVGEGRLARAESATAGVRRFLAKMQAQPNKLAVDTTQGSSGDGSEG